MNSKEKMTPDEKWDNATLANNFIFYKVMRNHPEACKHLIELLLKIKVNSMEIHGEEVIDIDHDAKGIRLDVFVKEDNRMYDIEVQVVNTKELPERARYYQGLMDLDSLKSGQKYRELPDSHIIFLCLEDIFKNSLPVSTFENICLEDLKTKLNDRAYKHFFIAPLCARMVEDKEVKDFFEFLISNRAADDYTNSLQDYVKAAKKNAQWKEQYMTYERIQAYAYDNGKEAGIAEGITQGTQQKAIEDAVIAVTKFHVPIDDVAREYNIDKELIESNLNP
ncbi:MAG: Rpn family recombination-promoting nuclease/putative transposase [Treponema sp.]|uniref:Rpn family recombination-promoting nuclease/putative transposase n=1 Tax=Treponema sp. TaxID=166 RepID=UPI00298E0A97|nr:Rpn family recombination-promoting nuclease/putative transposase [Treponema sp.]MBR5933955.1 Rpn family recombination-promoting nuclease/putative transposase [Treponema sp.]